MAIFEYHPGAPPQRWRPYKCQHDVLRFTWRKWGDSRRYGQQCLKCGCGGHKTREGDFLNRFVTAENAVEYFGYTPQEAASYHDQISQRIRLARGEFYATLRSERKSEFWDWYNKYLSSLAWKDKRQAVFRRDNFQCQRCGGDAEQVHHLSYENVGYEPLEDLVSVCASCHREIHE